jgi:hypothetical protein
MNRYALSFLNRQHSANIQSSIDNLQSMVFVFCYLKFFITETRTLTPETKRSLQHAVRKTPIKAKRWNLLLFLR